MRARLVSEIPIDLDKHRGMAAQKATDIRRVIADVEVNAKLLRDKQGAVEIQLLAVPAENLARGGGQGALRPQSLFGQSGGIGHASSRPGVGGAG